MMAWRWLSSKSRDPMSFWQFVKRICLVFPDLVQPLDPTKGRSCKVSMYSPWTKFALFLAQKTPNGAISNLRQIIWGLCISDMSIWMLRTHDVYLSNFHLSLARVSDRGVYCLQLVVERMSRRWVTCFGFADHIRSACPKHASWFSVL